MASRLKPKHFLNANFHISPLPSAQWPNGSLVERLNPYGNNGKDNDEHEHGNLVNN